MINNSGLCTCWRFSWVCIVFNEYWALLLLCKYGFLFKFAMDFFFIYKSEEHFWNILKIFLSLRKNIQERRKIFSFSMNIHRIFLEKVCIPQIFSKYVLNIYLHLHGSEFSKNILKTFWDILKIFFAVRIIKKGA